MDTSDANRRPLKTRSARWATALARALARAGFRPNQISVLSLVFAAFAALDFILFPRLSSGWRIAALADAALCMQLRLLCNMLDGMVAVEGGQRSKVGEIYNEMPDRFADALILVAAGNASPEWNGSVILGWAAALLAVLCAYTRALGVAAGASQQFCGPMAKPHRMAVMTFAALLALIEVLLHWPARIIPIALLVIIVGCIVTITRRTLRIAHELKSR
jgi:phosphatidylglycerophosphate synthase